MKMILLTLLGVLLLLAGGCKSSNEPTNQNEERKQKLKETRTLLYTHPLTGESTTEKSIHRPISVMVNNHPQARPQYGLEQADIVYEFLAEGGVTRFLAVYQSEMPEKFGPVRSARPYFVELAKGFDSLYIFHGWSPDAKELIQSGYIDSLNGLSYDGTLFKRHHSESPHNSYITYENILKGANEKGIQ